MPTILSLYQREGCPHCQRVREELTRQNLPFESLQVARLPVDRPDLTAHDGVSSREIPILRDGDRWIQGSEEILLHLRERAGAHWFGDPSFAYTRRLSAPDFQHAARKVRKALEEAGFRVLYELDMGATLEKSSEPGSIERSGAGFTKYLILGICATEIAHSLLAEEPAAGLLFPCNVVVAESAAEIVVSAVDPVALFKTVENRPALTELAKRTRARMVQAMGRIEMPTHHARTP